MTIRHIKNYLAGEARPSQDELAKIAAALGFQNHQFANKQAQILLRLAYRQISQNHLERPTFDEVEFRCHSQNGEDGILLYLFSMLGTTNKRCVEIAAGDGIQNNTANLIINHGWYGLMIDGNEQLIDCARKFYASHPDTFALPPQIIHAWITAENVDQLIKDNGFTGEIDLLSLDLDGVDWWIWKALTCVRPRVVVAEVQCIFGAEDSVTVPYRPDFKAEYVNGFGVYSGGSLSAFVKLAHEKGYRLVGVQRYGFNAFFVRNDLGVGMCPEVSAEECLDKPFVHWARRTLHPLVKDKEWVRV